MIFKMNKEKNINLDVEITFSKLYALKSKNNEDYKKINEIFSKGAKDFFDFLFVVYIGYLCKNEEPKYSFKDFIELTDFNLEYVIKVANGLYKAKKK